MPMIKVIVSLWVDDVPKNKDCWNYGTVSVRVSDNPFTADTTQRKAFNSHTQLGETMLDVLEAAGVRVAKR